MLGRTDRPRFRSHDEDPETLIQSAEKPKGDSHNGPMTEGLFISCSAVHVKPNRRAGLRRRPPAFLLSANQKTRLFASGSSPRCGPPAHGEEASSGAWVSRTPRAGSREARGGEVTLASARPAAGCLRSGLAAERRRKPNSRPAPGLGAAG
ncbi:PREDICTED: LOW QUALITY PROTEIN: putative uncharacterized protein encoded by LINC00167 [Mandrillus leucophaeus]|uniref:LOW QUALITY PROTEIN: putative uncharacterized protein encoded by LINC00167 n=1 Tax=Mandrillus leucophaeus TaxID=9568 RepID=UPI0005F5003C|nr:PREDICTED: LOW QUALITY PROTEIN: putative uncharacterized protein encoded by LINC00167 [Mandrillus leucophaeus]